MAINTVRAEMDCLYTTVRNIASSDRYFGFLPPHGRRLACGEEFTFWGTIQAWLWRNTPNERARRSFEEALNPSDASAPVLALVKTPAPHLYDNTLDVTQVLTLDNGAFVAADPCWGAYSSSAAVLC